MEKKKKQSPFIGKTVPLVDDNDVPLLYPHYQDISEILLDGDGNVISKVDSLEAAKGIRKNPPKVELNDEFDDEVMKEIKEYDLMEDIKNAKEFGGVEPEYHIKEEPIATIKNKSKKQKKIKKESTEEEHKNKKLKKEVVNKEEINISEEEKEGGDQGNKIEAECFRKAMELDPTPTQKDNEKQIKSEFSFNFTEDFEKTDRKPEQKSKEKTNDLLKVFVGGMPFSWDKQTVYEYWSECGEVASLELINTTNSLDFSGMAKITYKDQNGYQTALSCDGCDCEGLTIHVRKWIDKNKFNNTQLNNEIKSYPIIGEKVPGFKRAFVCSIPYDAGQEDIRQLFEKYGVVFVRIARDLNTGASKGYSHVEFESDEGLERAINEMDGYRMRGRNIRVGYAKPPADFVPNFKANEITEPSSSENIDKSKDGEGSKSTKQILARLTRMDDIPITKSRIKMIFRRCGKFQVKLLEEEETKEVNVVKACLVFRSIRTAEQALYLNDHEIDNIKISVEKYFCDKKGDEGKDPLLDLLL